MRCFRAESAQDWALAHQLVEAYDFELGMGVCFQDLAQELEHLAAVYGPPGGAFVLAMDGETPAGCVGLRRLSPNSGEIKRLYVVADHRGHGIGRMLAEHAIAAGRRIGYGRLLLDTLPSMLPAQRLYRSLGFRATAPYGAHPAPGTLCFELELP